MNNWEKLRQVRDWITSIVTILIIPVCYLVLDHQRLLIEKFVNDHYVPRVEYREYVSEHKEWGKSEVQRLEKQIDTTSIQYQGMNLKLDALILQVTALQTKLDSAKN